MMRYAIFIPLFLLLLSSNVSFAAQDFNAWLTTLKQEALQRGISQNVVHATLSGISPLSRVIELDRKQPEGKMTFAQYYKNVVNQQRIDEGRRLYQKHRALLDKISAQYDVQPQYIVALWGMETSYGKNTGGFGVVPALVTLAYDGRRSQFFRDELFNALKIIDQGHISASAMKGSWAGAMGQNQFMPSSFHSFAVDGNEDGRRDIWGSLPDVFASTAHYLHKSGWKGDERWGRRVRLPDEFLVSAAGLETKKTLQAWSNLGITPYYEGDVLPQGDMLASVVLPDGLSGPAYLVYSNYRTIMKWNKSTYFATSVGLLADQIAR